MITNEQILNDQGPSLKLPWSPNPFETAGRTNTIVEVPVIANTVHIKTISRYHAADQRSGIGFGAKNDFQKSEDDDDDDDDMLVVRGLVLGLACAVCVQVRRIPVCCDARETERCV
mmetsp:Transcript_3386/g.8165  ORF Transcript_3386/g.8165 Transcript_3386/m.8165 type:complete len:116 (+) Transcript_3386:619-966(+)